MKPKLFPKALVTGAAGVIGPDLVKRLIEGGYAVRALYRRYPGPKCLPDNVEAVQGDITNDETLREAVKDIDLIFHLAAKGHMVNPSSSLASDYRCINVEGTHRLVTAAKTAGVRRMIFFSTINVYGPGDLEKIYDENSPVEPATIYAETKAQAEEVVLSEMPSVVLRLAAVYGPRMQGNYRRLLTALKNRYFVMIGNGLNRRTLVHVQDVCQAAILAAGQEAVLSQIYNVTDGGIHTFQQIVRAMCSALGRGYPKIRIPQDPVRRMLGFVEDACQLFGQKAPIGRFSFHKLLEDMAVRGDKIRTELGYRPMFNLETGWKNCVESMTIK